VFLLQFVFLRLILYEFIVIISANSKIYVNSLNKRALNKSNKRNLLKNALTKFVKCRNSGFQEAEITRTLSISINLNILNEMVCNEQITNCARYTFNF
jgi:hypothetical protein